VKDARATLAKLEREETELRASVDKATARLRLVADAAASLRVLLGITPPAPPKRVHGSATGTKAVVLDVLSDGKKRKLADIATEAKVEVAALRSHVKALVAAGDVKAEGNTHSRAYWIP
jgi:hypothetical protein